MTFLWLFISEKYDVNVPSKSNTQNVTDPQHCRKDLIRNTAEKIWSATLLKNLFSHLGGLGQAVMEPVGVDNPAAADLVDGPHPAARHTGLLVRAHVTHRLQLHRSLLHTQMVWIVERLDRKQCNCRYLKKLTCRGTCGRCFICLKPPPPIWPHTPPPHPYTLYTCIQYTYSHREGGGGWGGGES